MKHEVRIKKKESCGEKYKMEKNTTIKTFNDLYSWKEAHKLALSVYKTTDGFPTKEIYSLTNQIRRAVISITSNIAEGFSRNSMKEKIQFYSIALGSTTEVQSQIFLSRDLGYIDEETFISIYNQTIIVHKLINGLIRSSKNKIPQ